MSTEYIKTSWQDGDIITADKMNNIENGIKDVEDTTTSLKEEISELSSIPTTVRQAMLTLFESAAYAETGLTDEIAVVESWAEEVTSLALNQTAISISGSGTVQLVATTVPAGKTVTWSSSDDTIATVSASGLVTGVSNGSVTITAACGDKRATCAATVSGFATLVSISAVYTQSGTVHDTDALDSLKSDLEVTAHMSDSTTRTVTNYVLSGTLTVGTSTITVTYGGKTTTFNVTVTDSSAIQVTYTQGSIGSGNTDANKVSGVITNGIHFDDGETLVITIEPGYLLYPYGVSPNRDESKAGTRSASNILFAYIVSDSGYVMDRPTDLGGNFTANNTNIKANGNTGWKTGAVTYVYEKTNQYGITVKGLGFLVKKEDESNITPSEIEQIISINTRTSS